jgi:hypothetical protein
VVETTRTQGKLLRDFNTTFLALIPREYNPATFENLDPSHYAIAYTKLSQR